MKVFIFLSLIFSLNSWAFTLNNNFGAAFKKSRVKVFVAGNSNCPGAGVTNDELQGLVKPAIDRFWNKVPTSSLRLVSSGFSEDITNIVDGKLCAPTDSSCITAATAANELIPPVSNIIISCNNNGDNFGNVSGVLAVTIPNSFSAKKIRGSVILIQDGATFGSLSRTDRISVLAHEIGHAIGLGHAEKSDALMYYRTVNLRSSLGQDDIDGVSYLYPVHIDSCGLIGSLKEVGPKGPSMMLMMLSSFGLLVLLFEIRKLLKKLPNLRPRFT